MLNIFNIAWVSTKWETIVHLENGRYNPSLKLAMDIAKVFNATVEDCFLRGLTSFPKIALDNKQPIAYNIGNGLLIWRGRNVNRTDAEEYVFGSILLLANKFQAWGDNMLDDLTMKQWFLLMLISKMGSHNPTIKEVADFSGTSRQNVKKMLEHLEVNGFVNIDKSERDARALNVTLSKKTYEYFAANAQKGAGAINALFSEITDDELNATIQTLNKLLSLFASPTLEEPQ